MMATDVTNDGQRRQATGDDDAEQPMQETLQSGSSMICKDKVNHEVKTLVTLQYLHKWLGIHYSKVHNKVPKPS